MDFCNCEKGKVQEAPVLGMASVPMQQWETPCTPDVAIKQGTIFPSLNLPFYVTDDWIGGVMR